MADSFQPARVIATDPGGVNEDVGGSVAQAAWVLDGATGVGEDGFTPGQTDAQWYAHRFDRFLREHVCDRDRRLLEIIQSGVQVVADEFAELAGGRKVDPAEKPSAAGVVMRWTESTLEAFALADCSLVLTFSTGEVQRFTDGRPYLRRLEQEAEHGMYRLMADRGLTTTEAREYIWPKLTHDRRKLRTSNRCWALCMSPEAANEGHYAQFDTSTINHLQLFSDGASRLVETFSTFDTWQEAAEWINRHGVEAAIDRLRTIEQDDRQCIEYPRIKTCDDATVVAVEFS